MTKTSKVIKQRSQVTKNIKNEPKQVKAPFAIFKRPSVGENFVFRKGFWRRHQNWITTQQISEGKKKKKTELASNYDVKVFAPSNFHWNFWWPNRIYNNVDQNISKIMVLVGLGSVWQDWAIYWTLGNHSKPWQLLICTNLLHS